MVAHSVSSFIAQKYLESYALKGLVLVNPVPPVPVETVRSLISVYQDCSRRLDLNDRQKMSVATKAYYNLTCEDIEFVPFPLNFMNSLVDPKVSLNLEGGT